MILIYDNRLKEGHIVSTGLPETDEKKMSVRAQERLNMFKNIISTEEVTERNMSEVQTVSDKMVKSNVTRQGYIGAVKKALQYIAEGDIYQINLSQRFSTPLVHHPLDIYEKLRSINPAPMGGFFNFDDLRILSNSPERFMRIKKK